MKYLITSLAASRQSTFLHKAFNKDCNSAIKEGVELIKAALSYPFNFLVTCQIRTSWQLFTNCFLFCTYAVK